MPLVLQWFWLGLRYGSLTLPSVINPSIEGGGLVGESKSACLEQIGPAYAPYVAPWVQVGPDESPVQARVRLGCAYPLIAKPDLGWCGYGVRRVEDDAALLDYARQFPPGATFIVQQLVAAPLEAGLFYARDPAAQRGRLLSVTVRHPPTVVGDGVRDVATLIGADPRLARHGAAFAAILGSAWHDVPGVGEARIITTVASLRVGARYEDVSSCASPALQARIDAIALSMKGFHWGRFDVRCASLDALREGVFQIIEVNGAGSEAINFWDPAFTLASAFAGVFAKQTLLFRLSAAMRRAGHGPMGVVALSRAWLRQRRLVAGYPPSN